MLKTQPTGASVSQFISAIPDPIRRGDCRTLASVMRRATGAKAEMWGPSIVGFGRFHYRYSSGREGEWFLAGFSPRQQDLTLYVMGGWKDAAELLPRLGRHKASEGGCLYVRRLADVDMSVLETLIARSAARLRAMHAPVASAEKSVKTVKAGRVVKAEKAVKAETAVKAVKAVKPARPRVPAKPARAKAPAKPARRGR